MPTSGGLGDALVMDGRLLAVDMAAGLAALALLSGGGSSDAVLPVTAGCQDLPGDWHTVEAISHSIAADGVVYVAGGATNSLCIVDTRDPAATVPRSTLPPEHGPLIVRSPASGPFRASPRPPTVPWQLGRQSKPRLPVDMGPRHPHDPSMGRAHSRPILPSNTDGASRSETQSMWKNVAVGILCVIMVGALVVGAVEFLSIDPGAASVRHLGRGSSAAQAVASGARDRAVEAERETRAGRANGRGRGVGAMALGRGLGSSD